MIKFLQFFIGLLIVATMFAVFMVVVMMGIEALFPKYYGWIQIGIVLVPLAYLSYLMSRE